MQKPKRNRIIVFFLGTLMIPLIIFGFDGGSVIAQESNESIISSGKLNTIVLIASEKQVENNIRVPFSDKLDFETKNTLFEISYLSSGSKDFNGITCSIFPEEVKTAFVYAANIWASTVTSSVPITIRACWGDLGLTTILGYSASYSYMNFSNAPLTNTWYSSSLVNSFRGSDINLGEYDIYITYNKNYNWYLGTDGITPSGEMDFVTVATHEIAHGLNFSGTAVYNNGEFSLGWNGFPNIYDRFIYNSEGTPIINFIGSEDLGSQLTSGELLFEGINAREANDENSVEIYAPPTWKSGSSYSHLDYETFSGTENSLMVYAIPSGTAIHNPGPIAIGILKDMGWNSALSTPSGVTATDGESTENVTISWNLSENATSYQIFRNTVNSTIELSSNLANDNESPYNDNSAVPGTKYYYWVKACNSIECSDYSISDSGYRDAGFLTAPTDLTASDSTYTDKISLTWNESGGANYYQVYRNNINDDENSDLVFDHIIGNKFDDISVTETEPYYYWVKACNEIGCSNFSSADEGRLQSSKVSPPYNVQASDGTYLDKIFISWDSNPGDSFYKVYRNSINTVFGSMLIEDYETSTSFYDYSISGGLTYYYWVKSCSISECSVFSSSDTGFLYQPILDKIIFLPLINK